MHVAVRSNGGVVSAVDVMILLKCRNRVCDFSGLSLIIIRVCLNFSAAALVFVRVCACRWPCARPRTRRTRARRTN